MEKIKQIHSKQSLSVCRYKDNQGWHSEEMLSCSRQLMRQRNSNGLVGGLLCEIFVLYCPEHVKHLSL